MEANLDDGIVRRFKLRPEKHMPDWSSAVDEPKEFMVHLVADPYSDIWETYLTLRISISPVDPWVGRCYLVSLNEAEIK